MQAVWHADARADTQMWLFDMFAACAFLEIVFMRRDSGIRECGASGRGYAHCLVCSGLYQRAMLWVRVAANEKSGIVVCVNFGFCLCCCVSCCMGCCT